MAVVKIDTDIIPRITESLIGRDVICIGECPSNSPFLKNNGAETPKGARPIVFKEWRELKIHPLYLINLINY